jgi:UDP-glucose 4-epimerase
MKILVTGGAGFIASHVVDAYVAEGHEVTIIDDLSSGRQENVNPKADFVKMDIRDEAVSGIFANGHFDILNHHAAQMDVRRSVADPVFDAGVNAIGTLNLLENCVKYDVGKVVFSSTGGAVYGEQNSFPADEEHPTWPICPYGITKLTGEKYLFYYKVIHGLSHVIFRYANVYGPRQNPHGEAGVVAIFALKLFNGEQPVINGDGKQTRDYVHVSDLVRANVMALSYDKSDVFNIGTSVETDVNGIFRLVNAATGVGAPEKHGPAKAGEQQRSCLSYDKIKNTLGWQPEISLAEGLQQTVDYFKNRQ